MTIDISERAFEDAVECALLHGGPHACPGGAIMAREASIPYGESTVFTAELKNPLNAQDVQDAFRQYMTSRDPREPPLAYGRCLAHFAVDPELVYVTTRLDNAKTRFLPFNKGNSRRCTGAGFPDMEGDGT